MRRVTALAFVAALAVLGFFTYRLLEVGVEADVYRARLARLSSDYGALRHRYNEVVRRTAVTELVVEDGRLSVSIRSADGRVETRLSPFDPSKEIYVDYVVVDGRLWIRRLFDEDTPPGEGMVIDADYVDIDWEREETSYGKAAYRALDEGRWVVSVTGDGSLGLAAVEASAAHELSSAPPVRDYAPLDEEVANALESLRPGEVAEALARRVAPRWSAPAAPAP